MPALLGALLLVVFIPSTSGAHSFNSDVNVTSNQQDQGDGTTLIFGQVNSGQAACEKGEQMRLVGGGDILDRDRTDGDGEFSLLVMPGDDVEKVKVIHPRSSSGGYNHSHNCGKDVSKEDV